MLSIAEICSYLETRGIRYSVVGFSDQIGVYDVDDMSLRLAAKQLGSIFKIGEVTAISPRQSSFSEVLDAATFYDELNEKAKWTVSVYCQERSPPIAEELEEYFADRLRRDGITKAKVVRPDRRTYKEQAVEILSEELLRRRIMGGGFEVIAGCLPSGIYFARTTAISDLEGFRERDFGRPFHRSILSMPPRLARALVNLAGSRPGESVLDPFCGTGTILQEALLVGVDVRGIDVDGRRVSETAENLRWISARYKIAIAGLEDRLFRGDARRLTSYFRSGSIQCIATEPILLPPLKAYPSAPDARKMLEAAFEVYTEALSAMVAVLRRGGRIALVTPLVRTREHEVLSFPFEELVARLGLMYFQPQTGPQLKYPLLEEAKEDQKVVRGVYVVTKD